MKTINNPTLRTISHSTFLLLPKLCNFPISDFKFIHLCNQVSNTAHNEYIWRKQRIIRRKSSKNIGGVDKRNICGIFVWRGKFYFLIENVHSLIFRSWRKNQSTFWEKLSMKLRDHSVEQSQPSHCSPSCRKSSLSTHWDLKRLENVYTILL